MKLSNFVHCGLAGLLATGTPGCSESPSPPSPSESPTTQQAVDLPELEVTQDAAGRQVLSLKSGTAEGQLFISLRVRSGELKPMDPLTTYKMSVDNNLQPLSDRMVLITQAEPGLTKQLAHGDIEVLNASLVQANESAPLTLNLDD